MTKDFEPITCNVCKGDGLTCSQTEEGKSIAHVARGATSARPGSIPVTVNRPISECPILKYPGNDDVRRKTVSEHNLKAY